MLEGNRINIRPMEEFDLKAFFQWSIQTREKSFFLNSKQEVEINSFGQLKKDYQEKRSQALIPAFPLIIEEIDGNTVGFFRFTVYPGESLNASMSIAFFRKEYFFDELGKEVGNLIFDYFFNRKNLVRVYAKVIEVEKESIDYLKLFGFKLEGIQRDQIFLTGRYLNLCHLGVLKEEVRLVDIQGKENDRLQSSNDK